MNLYRLSRQLRALYKGLFILKCLSLKGYGCYTLFLGNLWEELLLFFIRMSSQQEISKY